MVQIYAVNITDFPDESIPHLLSFVGEEKQLRLSAFYRREDCVRGLLADLLIRKIAAETFAVPVKNIRFGTNAYGKPSLQEPLDSLHYNLSHSGDWVVCITDDRAVGIDIEKSMRLTCKLPGSFLPRRNASLLRQNGTTSAGRHAFYGLDRQGKLYKSDWQRAFASAAQLLYCQRGNGRGLACL